MQNGKIKTYFERGFIGVINNEYNLTINNDFYNEDGTLKELECIFKTEDEIKEFRHQFMDKIIEFKIHGTETFKRKDEFNFNRKIVINSVVPRTNIPNKCVTAILKVIEIND